MNISDDEVRYCEADAKNTLELYKFLEKRRRKDRIFTILMWIIRVPLFPIFFILKLIKWTYEK